MKQHWSMGAMTATGLVVLAVALLRADAAPSVQAPAAPLIGVLAPDLEMAEREGRSVRLRDVLGASPLTFAYVVGADDCLGCGDFGAELRILLREFPHAQAFLIGVGPRLEEVQQYASRYRVEPLFDASGLLMDSLGVHDTPLFVAFGRQAEVLFADTRTGTQSRTRPVSLVIAELGRTLEGRLDPAAN